MRGGLDIFKQPKIKGGESNDKEGTLPGLPAGLENLLELEKESRED